MPSRNPLFHSPVVAIDVAGLELPIPNLEEDEGPGGPTPSLTRALDEALVLLR